MCSLRRPRNSPWNPMMSGYSGNGWIPCSSKGTGNPGNMSRGRGWNPLTKRFSCIWAVSLASFLHFVFSPLWGFKHRETFLFYSTSQLRFFFFPFPLSFSRIFSFHFRLPSFSSRHSFPLPSLRSKKYLVIFGRFSFHVAQHFLWTFRPLFYYCVVFLFQLVLFSSRSRENGKMFVRFFFNIRGSDKKKNLD